MTNLRSAWIQLLLAALLSGCAPAGSAPVPATTAPNEPAPAGRTLTVFAAASLTSAFEEIGTAFEASHPGLEVVFNFAGSQTLSAQLLEGAPADLFASANQAEMDKLAAAGLLSSQPTRIFTTNRLLVVLPLTNPAGIDSLGDLAHPGLNLVLADASVPVGKYSRQVLEQLSLDPAFGADFASRVLANLVSNETDVKQVLSKVQLGEADAGFVYASDSVAAPQLPVIEIPEPYNVLASYPVARLADASQPRLADEFILALLSTEGQAALARWGFTPLVP